MNAHEIDYEIFGEEMQFVEIELDPQETVIAEAGSFMMMEDGIKMETIFGDGSKQTGGIFGKLMNAGKRMLTGEGLFMTTYTNYGQGKKKVSFASVFVVSVFLGIGKLNAESDNIASRTSITALV